MSIGRSPTYARFTAILCVALATGGGCGDDARHTVDAGPAGSLASSPPARFDCTDLVQRVHHVLRPDGTGFSVHGATYDARVEGGGAIGFTARVGPVGPPAPRATRKTAPPSTAAECVFETASIARAEAELSSRPTEAMREDDGSVRLGRGIGIERVRATPDGVEQSWSFSTRPRGRGELVVRLTVSGCAIAGVTSTGHHFAGERGGPLVRYGAATWIDAHGERTPIAATSTGNALRLIVPDDLVERSAFPAELDPTVSAEFGVDQPIIGPAIRGQTAPAVAPDGSGNFLVVWDDLRTGSPDFYFSTGDTSVYAARVTAAGTLLDPTGIEICPVSTSYPSPPSVAWDGKNNWLVVFGLAGADLPTDTVVGTRVSASGKVLDPDLLTIDLNESATPHVAFDGKEFWVIFGAASGLLGVQVATSGAILTPKPVTLTKTYLPCDTTTGLCSESIACDTTADCLVTWADTRSGGASVYGGRLTKSGVAVDPTGVAISTTSSSDGTTGVAFDGTSYYVTWVNGAGPTPVMEGTVVSSALVPSGVETSLGSGAGMVHGGVAFDGTNWLTVWAGTSGFSHVYGARSSAAGALVDATPLALTSFASNQLYPSVAFGSGQYLVAFVDDRFGTGLFGSSEPIYATRVSPGGMALDDPADLLIAQGANDETSPAAAYNGTDYLVGWQDARGIYGGRVSSIGKALDPSGIAFSGTGFGQVAVASNGTDWLVLWPDGGSILGERLDPTGAVVGGGPFYVGGGYSPRVVFDGTNYFAVWSSGPIYGARIDPATGASLDGAGLKVATAAFAGESPAVASDGKNYLVVWEEVSADYYHKDIHGRLVSLAGALVGKEFPISSAVLNQWYPRVAWDGTQFLVVWQDFRNDRLAADVYGARVTSGGKVLDPLGIGIGTGLSDQDWPDVIDMNDGYTDLVVWQDNRDPKAYDHYDIYGAWIRKTDGAVLDPSGIALVHDQGDTMLPTLAPQSPGKVALFYQRVLDGGYRVRGSLVASGKTAGNACKAPTDCESRYCVSGFCCKTACDGLCQACDAVPGDCASVVSADSAMCKNDETCDAKGACKKKNGQSCALRSDCASGVCAAGICCDTVCDGECQTCAAPVGRCSLRTAGSTGSPTCAPFACDGTHDKCPTSCTSDSACPKGMHCDPVAGCVSGSYCVDDHTVENPGSGTVDCAPFKCEATACRTTCNSVADCILPAVCNATGKCTPPTGVSTPVLIGGCTLSSPARTGGTSGIAAAALALSALARRRRRRQNV